MDEERNESEHPTWVPTIKVHVKEYDKHMSCITVVIDTKHNAFEGTGLDRNKNTNISG